MEMVSESVSAQCFGKWRYEVYLDAAIGWYDSVYDQELGSGPCIFTSVTPVSQELVTLHPKPNIVFRRGIMSIWSAWQRKPSHH